MTEKRKLSTVLYDEQIQLPDGQSLRMYFDLGETIPKIQRYATELSYARRIPSNLEAISPKDPVLTYVTGQYADQLKKKLIDSSFINDRVTGYYAEQTEEVNREASLIALFSHPDNQELLAEEPEQYPAIEEENDPLILQMPVVSKNLIHPIERRLKRIMDLLNKSGAIFQVQQLIQDLGVRINMFALELVEVDENGFLPSPVNGDVPAQILPDDGEQKVQTGRSAGRRVSRPDGITQ